MKYMICVQLYQICSWYTFKSNPPVEAEYKLYWYAQHVLYCKNKFV